MKADIELIPNEVGGWTFRTCGDETIEEKSYMMDELIAICLGFADPVEL